MYADLLFYYGVDLFEFVRTLEPSPAQVFALVERLPDDSMTVAMATGGPEHFGWGTDRHLAASLYDALNFQTRHSVPWKEGKAPDFKEWPRPGGPVRDGKRKATVKSLFAAMNAATTPNRRR